VYRSGAFNELAKTAPSVAEVKASDFSFEIF